MTTSTLPCVAGVLYKFQFVAEPDFEIHRPVTDQYEAVVSEEHDGRVEVRGSIRCAVDAEFRVEGFLWGAYEEAPTT